MSTEQIIHKAFDIYCTILYNRTYPYAEDNLYKFLEDQYEIYYIKYTGKSAKFDMNSYNYFKNCSSATAFIEELKLFIKEHEKRTF